MSITNLHLPGPPPGTTYTVTHPDGTVTTITASASLSEAAVNGTTPVGAPLPEEVEEMIGRHEKNGVKGTRSRELVQALVERGWTPKAGPKYLRFIYQGDKGKVTLYANSRDLITRENEQYAKGLPGAKPTASGVRFDYIADFDTAVDAAVSMEGFALLSPVVEESTED